MPDSLYFPSAIHVSQRNVTDKGETYVYMLNFNTSTVQESQHGSSIIT